jgi:hypothetical protein
MFELNSYTSNQKSNSKTKLSYSLNLFGPDAPCNPSLFPQKLSAPARSQWPFGPASPQTGLVSFISQTATAG